MRTVRASAAGIATVFATHALAQSPVLPQGSATAPPGSASAPSVASAPPVASVPPVASAPSVASVSPVASASAGAPADQGAPIDLAAVRAALAAVDYRSCGVAGSGKVLVTFSGEGTVDRVAFAEGTFDAAISTCVAARFMTAKIPPFDDGPRTVKWAIDLGASTAVANAPEPAPTAGLAPKPDARPILPAEGPLPPGYHVERRARTAPLITGSVFGVLGLVFLYVAASASSRLDRELWAAVGIVHHLAAGPLIVVGLTRKRVYVADSIATVHLAPMIGRDAQGATLSLTF